jgi:hypothetical protein
MANRKATLIRCAQVPGLGWRRGNLIKTKNGRIKSDYMFVGTEFTRLLTERGKTYPEQVTEDDVIAFDRFLVLLC